MDHINDKHDGNIKVSKASDLDETRNFSALNTYNNHGSVANNKTLKETSHLSKEISHFRNETLNIENRFGMSNNIPSEKNDLKIDFADDKKSLSSSSSILDKFYNTYGNYLNNNSNNNIQTPQNDIKLKEDENKNIGKYSTNKSTNLHNSVDNKKNFTDEFLKNSIKTISFNNEYSQPNTHNMKFITNEDKSHSLNEDNGNKFYDLNRNINKKSNEHLNILEKNDSMNKEHFSQFLKADALKHDSNKTHDLDSSKNKKLNEHLNVLEDSRFVNKKDFPVAEKHDSVNKKQLSGVSSNEQFKHNDKKIHDSNENIHKKSNEHLEKNDSMIKEHSSQFSSSQHLKHDSNKTHDLDISKNKKSNEHLNVMEDKRFINKKESSVVEKHGSVNKKPSLGVSIDQQFKHNGNKSNDSNENIHKKSNEHLEKNDSFIKEHSSQFSNADRLKHNGNKTSDFDISKNKKSNEHLNVLEDSSRFLNTKDLSVVEKHNSANKKQFSEVSTNEQFKYSGNKSRDSNENIHKKSNEHLNIQEKDEIVNKNFTDKNKLNHTFNKNFKNSSYEKIDQNYKEHKLNDDQDHQVDALFESSQISARGLKAKKDFTKNTTSKNNNRYIEKKSNSSEKVNQESFCNFSREEFKKETGLSRKDSKLTHKSLMKDDDYYSKNILTSNKKEKENGFNKENELSERHKGEKKNVLNDSDIENDDVSVSQYKKTVRKSESIQREELGKNSKLGNAVNDSSSSSKTLPMKATLQLKDATKAPLIKSVENNAIKKQRPKSATLTKKSNSFTNISNFKPSTPKSSDQINSVLLREQIYYDWLQRKQSFTKELQQEKLKKNQEEEDEKRVKEEEKKLLAKKSFEAWTETKIEKLKTDSIKKKQSKEKKKELEEENAQKIKDSKKTFDNWKETKDERIKKENLKKQKEETKKKKEELNQSLEKAADAKKVFENWKQQKDELLKKKIIEQKEEIKNKTKAELDKIEKMQQSQLAFENWKEKKSSRPSSPALTQRAWCPVGRNPKDSIPASVQPVILRNVPPSIRMRTLSVS